ncbi:MAG: alanine--glyoxylate aminotransferase family protein [Syntrophomonadaceae bacterium]|nr:alanine--glyoxylate aminotransferase family protein [Syntrophomonadaceae bacterium]
MTGEQFLLLPGPTPLPDRVARAMSQPMINHRGPEFKQILLACTEGIKKVYRTKQNVIIFPASGTGALEAAVVNFISPGDKVLSVSIGVFGERFAQIAGEFGAQVEKISFEWGTPADPQMVKDKIKADVNKEIKAVLVTQNETSTGVFNDIKAIREAIGDHPALLMVDAVSGLAAVDLCMDEWKLDVVVSGSQKAFMIPPGLSFLAFNDRALKVHEKCSNPRYYWDAGNALKYLEKGQNPYTPAITLYYALHEALQMMMEEGLDNILQRHMDYRDMVRAAVRAMNLQPLAVDAAASPALTSVIAPEEIGANKIRKYLQDEFNIVLAGGQQKLDNVIFRIGHLGYIRELDLLSVLAALEIALLKFGHHLELGAGVNQAQQFLMKKHS